MKILSYAVLLLVACGSAGYLFRWQIAEQLTFLLEPNGSFEQLGTPPAPDYGDSKNWALYPEKGDEELYGADVLFFHPTTYFGKDFWNQPLESAYEDATLHDVIFVNQSSVFDSHARIFAPYYRQASLYSLITHDPDGQKSVDLAFSDIQRAFSYYIAHENNGRPFVIAGHSQGSYHGLRLLEQDLVNRPVLKQLVAAYLVGILIPADKLTRTLVGIPLCESPAQTSCLVTWNTIGPDPHIMRSFNDMLIPYPTGYESIEGKQFIGVNPLTWRVDTGFADQELNLGGFIGGFDETADALDVNLTGAEISEGWLSIPEIQDDRYHQIMLGREFYHVYDYALFHENIRQNVGLRLDAYYAENN